MAFTLGTDFYVAPIFTTGSDFQFITDLQGNASGTLDNLTGAATACFDNIGSASATLDNIIGAASAEFSNPLLGTGNGNLSDLIGSGVGEIIRNVASAAGTLESLIGSAIGVYDVNVHRYVISELCAGIDQATLAPTATILRNEQSSSIPRETILVESDAAWSPVTIPVPVEQIKSSSRELCSLVDDSILLSQTNRVIMDHLTLMRKDLRAFGEDGIPRSQAATALFDLLRLIHSGSCHPVDDAGLGLHDQLYTETIYHTPPEYTVYSPGIDFDVPGNRDFTLGTDFIRPYTTTVSVFRMGFWLGVITRENCNPIQRGSPAVRHQCFAIQDGRRPPPGTSTPVDPPPPPPPPPPPGHTTLVIPTQSVYTMQHVITVVTLVGNVAVPMSSVSLSLSADAFAWQFSGVLADPDALSLVDIVDNQPVQLAVTIDGYLWHVLVEEIEHSREFAKSAITLKGRSLSALLGGPYEQPKSVAYGSDLTVQQLAEMQLPFGWTLNWTQVTWLVPGGAWSYTNQTPIQALAGIANDTGSMLVPARSGQSLTMMPRYPYWPWDFSGATPDLVVPEAAVKSVSLRPRLDTQANGVYVHGGEVGGVLGWCRFNGTDGARLAATVNNNLMTDVIGCRALGSRILSGQYTQPIIKNFTTWLDGNVFPLAEVGMLVSVTLGAENVRGIINSVSIEASLSSVTQTIQIGEETPNVWALFKELLPRDPLLVGTLASTDGSTSIITLLDGGVVSVRGTGTVGNKYYIRAGRIEGDAPNLAQQEIVV